MAWHEKLVAWELSIHELSMRERRVGFPMTNKGSKYGGEEILRGFVEGSEERMKEEE